MTTEGWIKIFSSNEEYQVKIAEDILKQNSIESHIVKHPDSAFPSLGEAALYTLPEKAERAKVVLTENKIK